MFPTLSSLTEYLFGIYFELTIHTFGFFVAISFVFAYITFLSEFKRKEKEGVIKSFTQKSETNSITLFGYYLSYGFLGFIIGFKVLGAFLNNELFFMSPIHFIFSLNGSWILGVLFCGAFVLWAYKRPLAGKNEVPSTTEVYPSQLMPKLVIWAAVWGFLGAKIFNYLENYNLYANYSLLEFLQNSGLTFYGGLVVGGAAFLYIGYKNKMRLVDLTDIGSPGMFVAYSIGRIGCQLSGDGDWGVVNTLINPFTWLPNWMWSFKFPHNVLNVGQYIPGCNGEHCMILPQGVYPTSFYETVIILTAFSILWLFRKKMKIPGTMFSIFLIVNGVERFIIEFIRVNPKHGFLGLLLTQAQIIALIFIIGGVLGLILIIFNKRAKVEILNS